MEALKSLSKLLVKDGFESSVVHGVASAPSAHDRFVCPKMVTNLKIHYARDLVRG